MPQHEVAYILDASALSGMDSDMCPKLRVEGRFDRCKMRRTVADKPHTFGADRWAIAGASTGSPPNLPRTIRNLAAHSERDDRVTGARGSVLRANLDSRVVSSHR